MQRILNLHLRKIKYYAMLVKMLDVLINFVIANLLAQIINFVTLNESNNVLRYGLFLFLLVVIIKVVQTIIGVVYERMRLNAVQKCKINLYRQFLSNRLNAVYSLEHGETIEKLNTDFEVLIERNLSVCPNLWIGCMGSIAYVVYLAFQDILIAGVLLVLSVFQIIPPIMIKKFMQVNYDECRDIEAEITDFTVSGYRGFATIKLYQLKEWWLKKLALFHKEYTKIGNASIYATTAENTLNEFISIMLKYGTYLIVGLFVLLRKTEVSIGVQAIALSSGLFSAVMAVFSAIPSLAVAHKAESRLSSLFAKTKQADMIDENCNIVFSNVEKSIENKVILKGLDVSFKNRGIYVIKGANGSGKTTFFNLIAGLLACDNGIIKVGSVKPTDFSDKVFPKQLFYLFQEDALFDFSPYTLFELVDKSMIPVVIKLALEFHLSEKQIYETKINELSGGERKKVYLSLAFALDPVLLLLDEPTNSLDIDSKKLLVSLLKKRKQKTLIISHDPILEKVGDYVYNIAGGGITLEKQPTS